MFVLILVMVLVMGHSCQGKEKNNRASKQPSHETFSLLSLWSKAEGWLMRRGGRAERILFDASG
jgi:hypothetical protein